MKQQRIMKYRVSLIVAIAVSALVTVGSMTPVSASEFEVKQADWLAGNSSLRVEGDGQQTSQVVIRSKATGNTLATVIINNLGKWTAEISGLATVPCSVVAESQGTSITKDVDHAPADCDAATGASVTGGAFQVLAANDLGMHCADQDYRIFSILPPFNVVHAQVIQKGTRNNAPRILTDQNVDVLYSAASNPNDPVGILSVNTTSQNNDAQGILRAYKSNFWDTNPATGQPYGFDAYAPLYFGLLPPAAIRADVGLPVPDSVLLPIANCLNDPNCLAQQEMPGIANPYVDNIPKRFDRFDHDFNFFRDFPFGSLITDVNWFAADGIPILPVDDLGRVNAYPLMKVEARSKTGGQTLASVDVVLPVASEADCQSCHADQPVCDHAPTLGLVCNGIAATFAGVDFDVITDASGTPGDTAEQRVLNAAKINILRLHDAKHQTQLDASRPVVCATCHYSPALDLAQLGPQDDPSVGTEQTQHHSMSYAMHFHHGNLEFMGEPVFPKMPAPLDAQGNPRDPMVAQQVLEQNCYQCHPGKRTQCLRGAMFTGGAVCQDCHGDLQQVGNDFTKNFPSNPGVATAGLRVPWASEPGCQSCHTGDAVNNLNSDPNVLVANDGIRLLQAFRTNDADASPIKATASAFAEDESLYRLSKGHGGVMCEGCHGSTHAIWPIQNASANDNVTAEQLQGHTGTIIECTTCHAPGSFDIDDFKGKLDENGRMKGPHGMHPVDNPMWNEKHKEVFNQNPDVCQTCHGVNLEGTVLAKVAADRNLECKDRNLPGCGSEGRIVLTKGTEVSCSVCHKAPSRQ